MLLLEAVAIVLVLLIILVVSASRKRMSNEIRLRIQMRRLWYDHVARTRFFVISAIHALPDKSASLEYLMNNQDNIGRLVARYYGDVAGGKLSQLLREHIKIAGSIVASASSQGSDLQLLLKKWEENADQIADFLAAANSKWSRAALGKMMREHLAVTTTGLTLRLDGQYAEEAANFDKIVDQALHMADVLTDGIAEQHGTALRGPASALPKKVRRL